MRKLSNKIEKMMIMKLRIISNYRKINVAIYINWYNITCMDTICFNSKKKPKVLLSVMQAVIMMMMAVTMIIILLTDNM